MSLPRYEDVVGHGLLPKGQRMGDRFTLGNRQSHFRNWRCSVGSSQRWAWLVHDHSRRCLGPGRSPAEPFVAAPSPFQLLLVLSWELVMGRRIKATRRIGNNIYLEESWDPQGHHIAGRTDLGWS